MSHIVIGMGANIAGAWGNPLRTVQRALDELASQAVEVVRCSSVYLTAPVGRKNQQPFYNAAATIEVDLAPASLLRLLKACERHAGRRQGERWGPRPLDLDILMARGGIIGRPLARRVAGRIVIPHPELHRRAFALVPLAEIQPTWRHPLLGLTAGEMLRRLPPAERRGVRRLAGAMLRRPGSRHAARTSVDRRPVLCDKTT